MKVILYKKYYATEDIILNLVLWEMPLRLNFTVNIHPPELIITKRKSVPCLVDEIFVFL